MKQSEAIKQFQKLYWDDLTPEQINYLGQTEHEVVQLEVDNAALHKKLVESNNKGMEIANKLEDLQQDVDQLKIDLDKPPQERSYCTGCSLLFPKAGGE